MSSYDARLGLPEQPQLPLPVRLVTTGDNITLHVGDTLIADWPLERISITREKRGFRIMADGEDLIVDVTEANRFAMEMGITDIGHVEALSGQATDRRRAVEPSH
ncbi:MAG: hypothetical protein ACLFRT_10520 [Actinomycetota bacterium]